VSLWEAKYISSSESKVHLREQRICVGGRSSYMWEAENFKGSRGSLFLEAEDLWDAEDLCEKQCIFVESRVSL